MSTPTLSHKQKIAGMKADTSCNSVNRYQKKPLVLI